MVPDEQHSHSETPTPFRRTFLTAVAGTGTTLGIGGIVFAQQPEFDTIRLGGVTAAWQGREPSMIDGESNPRLPLQAGSQYTVVWVNVDGEPHNFAILDETGSAVVRSEIISEQGATQQVEFTAEPGMTTYLCQVHPVSMRGEVAIQGGDATGMNATGNMTNATDVTTNETQLPLEQFRTEELEALGEATGKFVAELSGEDVSGLPGVGNLTITNGTAAGNATAAGAQPQMGGNATTDNETAIEAQTPDDNETVGNETVGNETAMGNRTDGNETAIEAQTPDDNETATNVTVDSVTVANETATENETAIEAQRQTGTNETATNETVGNGTATAGETVENETVENETAMGNETAGNETQLRGQPQTNAARFTLQPPDGSVSKLLYNVALWDVQDVTGAEIFITGQDGQNVVVASMLAPEDPVDFPQGVIAYGEITAADLLGPLTGESLVALVDAIRSGNAYVVVRTRAQPEGALVGQIRPAEGPADAGNGTGTTDGNGTGATGGNQTNG